MMSTLFRLKAVKQQNEQKYKMLQLFLAAGILGDYLYTGGFR